MIPRSHPARWFELLTVRADLTLAVETLARTDAAELETHGEIDAPRAIPDLRSRLAEFHRLAERYSPYWPSESLHPIGPSRLLFETMDAALSRLHSWREEADPLIQVLEVRRAERGELRILRTLVEQMRDSPVDLGKVARAESSLCTGIYVLAPGTSLPQIPAGVLARVWPGEARDFMLLLGCADVGAVGRELEGRKARRMTLPPWLLGGNRANWAQVSARLDACARTVRGLEARIEDLAIRHEIRQALSDIARLEWFVTHSSLIAVSDTFGWVTGWTSDLEDCRLREALDKAGVRGLLRYPEPPDLADAPMVMRNPLWAQPFEVFARLLGIPGRDEADPSQLLAVIVPLMFGYMFGDVGQGATLLAAGLVLRRRWPGVSLLVPCGVSAMLFGVLFGSVFSREDLIVPLWLHPLEQPVRVLVVPLIGGVLVLVLSLLLNGVGVYWRGNARTWWRADAGVLALYAGLLTAVWDWRFGGAVALGGALWYIIGSTWENRRRHSEYLRALARTVEHALQLVVNTVSFARVGAFALAHAGVSLAIVTLAEASGHPAIGAAIMLVGNLIVVFLEGLVVSIQTTRLVLFEFFLRFLQGQGRVLRPLRPPAPLRVAEPIGEMS